MSIAFRYTSHELFKVRSLRILKTAFWGSFETCHSFCVLKFFFEGIRCVIVLTFYSFLIYGCVYIMNLVIYNFFVYSQATETLFRMGVARGTITTLRNGEVR